MIRFEHVDYSIGGRQILENVSFVVEKGTTKIILGPSGIGKSTALRLILGLVRPSRGDIFVDGQSVVHANGDELNRIRQRIGMVFQDGALFDSLTVGENIGYWLLENSHASLDEVEKIAREKLGLVGLDPGLIDSMPDELSLGMQRRVAIARALAAGQPKVILYDEPTTGLDPITANTINGLIRSLQSRLGITSIVVTHDIHSALAVSDRIAFLYEGGIRFHGTTAEAREAKEPLLRNFLQGGGYV